MGNNVPGASWQEIWWWTTFGFLVRMLWDHRSAVIDFVRPWLDPDATYQRPEGKLLGGASRFQPRSHVRRLEDGGDALEPGWADEVER